MHTLWLSLGTFVVFVCILLIAAAIAAEGAINGAKHNTHATPAATWVVGSVAIGLCAGMLLIFVQHFGLLLFGWHIERYAKLIIFVFGAVGLWLMMLDMAQRIIRRYYPDVVFEPGQDLTIATLGQKREGEGAIQDLF